MQPSRLVCAGFLLLASLLLAACSSSKPEAAVEAFFHAAAKRDVDKAMDYLAFGELSDSELFQAKGKVQMIVGQIAETIDKNDGLKGFEVVESTVDEDGQSARVKLKLIFNNGQEQTDSSKLRREDGKWKIVMG